MDSNEEKFKLVAETISTWMGEQQAITAALCGLLRALADNPSVKKEVVEHLERAVSSNLAQSLNVLQVEQFDATARLLRLALGEEQDD